jgi:hypothetical protein
LARKMVDVDHELVPASEARAAGFLIDDVRQVTNCDEALREGS